MQKADKVHYVKRQGQTRDHHCHWPGCGKQVPPAVWGCKEHWFRLSERLRDRIWAAFRPGQETNWSPSREYVKVAREVQEWLAQEVGGVYLPPDIINSEAGKDQSMAGQVTKSALFAKYGAQINDAVKAAAHDDADYGQMRLPGGISNGVAQIVECGFFQYAAGSNMKRADGSSAVGDWYFRAAGVVVEPFDVQGVRVQGLQTSVMEPVCPTKNSKGEIKSVADHVKEIENHLRILGADTTALADASGLEQLATAVKAARPYFRFSTSLGKATEQYPDPRVWENWHGSKGLEGYEPPGEDGAVQDNTAAATAQRPSANGAGVHGQIPVTPLEEADAFENQDDLDILLSKADGGDADAGEKLKDAATELGMTEDDFSAASWEDVVTFIRENSGAQSAGEGGDETKVEPSQAPPEKGQTVKYRADPKTKKLIDCEIISVNSKASTVTLKNLITGKPILGKDKKPMAVGFDELS